MARPLRIQYPGVFYPVIIARKRTQGHLQDPKGPGAVSLICGIGRSALRGGSSRLVPDAQPLSPAAGNTIGQPVADYEAHQWCIHDVCQRQTEAGRPSVPRGTAQGKRRVFRDQERGSMSGKTDQPLKEMLERVETRLRDAKS